MTDKDKLDLLVAWSSEVTKKRSTVLPTDEGCAAFISVSAANNIISQMVRGLEDTDYFDHLIKNSCYSWLLEEKMKPDENNTLHTDTLTQEDIDRKVRLFAQHYEVEELVYNLYEDVLTLRGLLDDVMSKREI